MITRIRVFVVLFLHVSFVFGQKNKNVHEFKIPLGLFYKDTLEKSFGMQHSLVISGMNAHADLVGYYKSQLHELQSNVLVLHHSSQKANTFEIYQIKNLHKNIRNAFITDNKSVVINAWDPVTSILGLEHYIWQTKEKIYRKVFEIYDTSCIVLGLHSEEIWGIMPVKEAKNLPVLGRDTHRIAHPNKNFVIPLKNGQRQYIHLPNHENKSWILKTKNGKAFCGEIQEENQWVPFCLEDHRVKLILGILPGRVIAANDSGWVCGTWRHETSGRNFGFLYKPTAKDFGNNAWEEIYHGRESIPIGIDNRGMVLGNSERVPFRYVRGVTKFFEEWKGYTFVVYNASWLLVQNMGQYYLIDTTRL